MLLQFNWDRLDITTAHAIRSLINAKLDDALRQHFAKPPDVSPSPLESIRVTSIDWGTTPPFVELLELDDAREMGGPVSLPDRLAPFVGNGGLFLRLHVTYGGAMRLAVAATWRHDVRFGAVALPLRMPLALHFAKMDMDFYLCLNFHHNACGVWMEPGKLSTSPITRMSIAAVFGERRSQQQQQQQQQRVQEGSLGVMHFLDDAESDVWTHVGSSHLGSDEDDDTVFIDESVVSQFLLTEIRAILQEKILYPHYVTIPLTSVE